MRIGIDAKQYFTGPISTKIILQNVLPILFDSYSNHEWIVFFDKKDKHRGSPFLQKNVIIQYVYTPTNLLSNLFILPKYISKTKPDITLFMMFAPFIKSSKSVVFIHDVLFRDFPQFFTWKERLYFKPIAWLSPKADRIICTTTYVFNKLAQYRYADKAKINIVPLGVSKRFQPIQKHNDQVLKTVRSKFCLPKNYMLFVGRLNVRKNIETLLRAIPFLENKEIKLVVVGNEDWKAPKIKNFLLNESIANRLIFTGSVKDDELAAIYAMATIFCFPSFAEGFGLPPLEAMASGVPAVVSNATAMPEIGGLSACYVDPTNAKELAFTIDRLLIDDSFYHEKRISGIQHSGNFSWESTAHRLMESIMDTMGNET